jgi:hypothetical protein
MKRPMVKRLAVIVLGSLVFSLLLVSIRPVFYRLSLSFFSREWSLSGAMKSAKMLLVRSKAPIRCNFKKI